MTLEEFNKGFKVLLDYYPNTKVSQGLTNLYFSALSELTMKEFKRAVGRIVKEYEGEFLPKVPVILKYARNDSVENQLILAKKMLQVGISRHASGMVNFEDKGVHAVIDFIGWRRLCGMLETEMSNFLNFQFDSIYKGFLERPYETSQYYTGISSIFGQTKPETVTYASIGINPENLKFISLEYKAEQVKKIDFSEMRSKMLVNK